MTTCKACNADIVVDCGYETPKHGYCVNCASARLDEIMSATLPPDELHIRASSHEAKHPNLSSAERLQLNGWWVQAPALGTVRAPVALAFAASIIRECEKIETATAKK